MKRFLFSLISGAVLAIACTRVAAEEKPGVTIPSGDVRSEYGYYSIVFYYSPDPTAPTTATAKALVEKFLPGIRFVTEPIKLPKPPFVALHEEKAPLKDFPVPGDNYFKYAGRGLAPEDITAFRKTTIATSLLLVVPKEDVWASGQRFTTLAHEYAVATKAVLWDSSTRECFSRDAWKEQRLADWKAGTLPQVSKHVTIHLYHSGESATYLRAITLGMEKFALPDVVIEQLLGSDNRPAGNLINLVCQAWAENPQVEDGSKYLIRVASIKNDQLKTDLTGGIKDEGTGEIALGLVSARRDEGDPENRLVEIDFHNSPGRSTDERRQSALSVLWGSHDSMTRVKHDAELLAASNRARERLPELQKLFEKELAPGVRLLLKAPFQRDDEGDEWMWVEILQWPKGGKATGILQNDPFYVKKLRAGSRVMVKEADVFDYILYRADGTSEGNETGRIMEKREGQTMSK